MLRFFGKIRYKLAVENRVAKYSRYAIGEILLVVIGILIALQVNNWNEDRKMLALKNSYKYSLIEDLKKDTEELKGSISNTESDVEKLLIISAKLSEYSSSTDSIIRIYRQEYTPIISEASSNFNRNTIEGLLATGHINLFEKELYNRLMNLNALQQKTKELIGIEIGIYMRMLTINNIPFVDEFNSFHGELLEQVWEKIDKNTFLIRFNTHLSSKLLVYKIHIQVRQELLKETESILNMLSN